MTGIDWLLVGVGAGGATYMFRALPFALSEESFFRRPRIVRFATLTSLSVTAGLVSNTIIGTTPDGTNVLVKGAAVIVAVALAAKFRSALVPLFTAVTLAAMARYYLDGS